MRFFKQNLAWGESSRSAPYAKFHRCGFQNVDLQAKKIAKIDNFWYKFAPKGYIPSP